MKKEIYFILILGIAIFSVNAQSKYPKGVYTSFEALKSMQPAANYNIVVEKKTHGNIVMNGGNDYRLISTDKTLKKKYLREELFAYSDGETLFLNCFPLRLSFDYTKVLNDGSKYFVFRATFSQDQDMSYMFGTIGGAFLATERYLYAYEKSTGNVILITTEALKKLLKDNETLLEEYLNEKNNKDEAIQLKYLLMLNGM